MFAAVKIFIAASIIAGASWLAGKKPELAGFITALPLVSILAIAFAYWHHQDMNQTAIYAKSIFVAVPLSLVFFLPFLVAEKWGLGFWVCFIFGIVLLCVAYAVHKKLLMIL